ncbi:hypothetical protein IRZ71_11320 [Flavobacterium sp. ANB]|uniref:hypothetical protein n=1 Tax=unclassified Flavobacterium TaxID=196869 RepID=UPI0012B95062|nr:MULTISPECIES: hypothetical protein [unclassified Flavobacterium]MBF4516941.1 hypothetical protein [Flavobacterium sp. ANB]MTD69163.1 hypothetical protein [Flavobacterium sp. LC2016-13]
MENTKNSADENYGKCVHSSIYVAETTDLIYRKAYIGDWGDWDEKTCDTSTDQNDCVLPENEIL